MHFTDFYDKFLKNLHYFDFTLNLVKKMTCQIRILRYFCISSISDLEHLRVPNSMQIYLSETNFTQI